MRKRNSQAANKYFKSDFNAARSCTIAFQSLPDRIFFLLLITLLMTVTELRAEPSGNNTPEQVITTLQDTLIQAMQQSQPGYTGRLELLTPVIPRTHDLPAIIRSALGMHWAGLSPEQQQAIAQVFQENTIATYADRFNQYDREHFEIVGQQQLPRGRILIRSQFIQTDSSTIGFDYVLHQVNEGWRIINIVVDGVSDLALKRTEYGAILQKNGIAALIDTLKQKTAQIEQNQP